MCPKEILSISLALLFLISFLILIVPLPRENPAPIGEKMPRATEDSFAFWNGTHAFIMGGSDEKEVLLDNIWLFDPETETVTTLEERLPYPMDRFAAVYTGRYVFIYGGYNGSHLDDIWRFNPETRTFTKLNETLPSPRFSSVAVWNDIDNYSLIYAGNSLGNELYDIVRHDPETGEVITLLEKLPMNGRYTSCVWFYNRTYCFGGTNGTRHNHIAMHDPFSNTVSAVNYLPQGRMGVISVKVNNSIYFMGGAHNTSLLYNDIYRFNPENNKYKKLRETLPIPIATGSIVYTGSSIYIFGGTDISMGGIDTIIRYDPTRYSSGLSR
ncbi:MAG: hypothetical protein DRO62_03955 [Candidatus Altiarchaeales archaeon]|nr:MAG: hypothetical protein DRO62_03955 [Candidatus Altiarchaeales archaeon]